MISSWERLNRIEASRTGILRVEVVPMVRLPTRFSLHPIQPHVEPTYHHHAHFYESPPPYTFLLFRHFYVVQISSRKSEHVALQAGREKDSFLGLRPPVMYQGEKRDIRRERYNEGSIDNNYLCRIQRLVENRRGIHTNIQHQSKAEHRHGDAEEGQMIELASYGSAGSPTREYGGGTGENNVKTHCCVLAELD
jgi:hypothetical protein